MPPQQEPTSTRSFEEVVQELGIYPPDAYQFVQEGLSHTVQHLHGDKKEPRASRHVSGPQLCEGLRELALSQWGMLARTVLRRWNITSTLDFGRIVFALIEAGEMQKTNEDVLEDFRNVYDFKIAFDAGYQISSVS